MGSKKTTNSRDAPEQVLQVSMDEIHPFKNHPFKVLDDEMMQQTVDSIKQVGILNPTIIRPDPDGGYEMISGHRRMHAAELAGFKTLPALVRNLTNDEAVMLMVDSNLQRESISPMEQAYAYKMKLEALRHQGKRVEATSPQLGQKSAWAVTRVAEDAGSSRSQVQRFIRLTDLNPALQEMVNSKKIAVSPAVELSFLSEEEQKQVLDAMEYSQNTPSLSQAQKLKKLSKEGKCTQAAMYAIMSEEKKPVDNRSVILPSDTIRRYFPKNFSKRQVEETIIKLLQEWQKKRQRQKER